MPEALSLLEAEVINGLRAATGLDVISATMAVVMLSRGYERPKRELAHLLGRYPGLEDARKTARALDQLLAEGWLAAEDESGLVILRAAPDLATTISSVVGTSLSREQVQSLRPQSPTALGVIGQLTDPHVYQSYLRELEQAQEEISLWMLATSPDIAAVPILRDRARAGVKVRLLIGAPSTVASLRGGSASRLAEAAVAGWKRNVRGQPNMELRLISRIPDAYLAGSMVIDHRLARITVYDPHRERGMDGLMLEARSTPTRHVNLVWLYGEAFEAAWARSSPTSRAGRVRHEGTRLWPLWLAVITFGLSFVPIGSAWAQLMYGISATALFLALVRLWPRQRFGTKRDGLEPPEE